MQGIYEAVKRQLEERRGGADLLPLWDDLWHAYRDAGAAGVDECLRRLIQPGDDPGDADG